MKTDIARRPATTIRTYTQQVRDHVAAAQRLQDQYFAALKRAESQYFEGMKKITDGLTEAAGQSVEPDPTQNGGE